MGGWIPRRLGGSHAGFKILSVFGVKLEASSCFLLLSLTQHQVLNSSSTGPPSLGYQTVVQYIYY